MNKDQMKRLMEKFENDKRSLDEVVGYVIRKSHEDGNSSTSAFRPKRVSYDSVTTVIRYLREYFDTK